MMQSLTFRKARLDDVNDILAALQALKAEQGMQDRFALTPEKLQDALFSKPASAEALLAFAGNEFAGLILFSPTNRNFDVFERPGLYIHSLYVLKQFRRQGIAKKLIDKIKEIAKRKNYGRIDWVTLKSNNVGAQFYQTIDDVKVVDYIDYMRIRIN